MTRRRSQPVSGEVPLPVEPKDVVKGITGRIKHFSPSWFSVTMGTGIPATLLLSIPFPWARHLRIPSLIFLLLDTALFCMFTLLMILRYVRWPWIWTLTWTHATHSLFIGTFPMSLFTLISGCVSVSQAFGGGLSWVYAMAVCWWISVVVAIGVAIAVPFLSYVTHRNFPESLTASLILPIVPLITGAAVGAVLSDHLYAVDPEYAQHIWMTSYVILGPGLLLAFMIMALYIQRLTFHHIPPNETIVSSFLPLGPTGLGGFSALKLGAVAVHLLPLRAASTNHQFPEFAGVALWGFGLALAMLLWGLGVWFGLIAVAGLAWRAREGNLRFNLGYWGLTFPLASLTLSTQLIGQELDSFGFKVTSTVFTFTMVTLWVCVSIPTCRGVLSGSRFVFAAPCLSKPEDRNSNAALASKTSGTSDAAGSTTPNNSARTSSDGGSHNPRRKEETEAEEEERKEGLMTEKTGTGGE